MLVKLIDTLKLPCLGLVLLELLSQEVHLNSLVLDDFVLALTFVECFSVLTGLASSDLQLFEQLRLLLFLVYNCNIELIHSLSFFVELGFLSIESLLESLLILVLAVFLHRQTVLLLLECFVLDHSLL